jgi:hypothetical protein
MRYSILCIVIYCFASCTETKLDYFTKEEFKDRISRSVPSVEQFDFLDTSKRIYTDSVFRLPAPTYKARVISTNAPNDTFFFYFFARKNFDTVLLRNLIDYPGDVHYFPGEIFLDTVSNNCVTYFRSMAGYEYEGGNLMDKTLELMLGYKIPTVTAGDVKLEEVRLNEENSEPPPPPPPKPGKK